MILKNKCIYILVDTDCDGMLSSSLAYRFIIENYPQITPIPVFHKNPKSHSLDDVIDDLLKLEPSFLWIPDAGSLDKNNCKILKDEGWIVICSDHHLSVESDNPYATVVNNQFGDKVDKCGSGTLVTWQFCNYLKPKSVNKYISYVALSILSDSMDLKSPQNATFIKKGKERIHKNLLPFVEKFIKDRYNNKDYSFNLINKFNACIRYGSQEDKEELFDCLVGKKQATEEFFAKLKSIHRRQNADKKKLVDEVLSDYSEDSRNYLIVKLPKSTSISGLVANDLLHRLNKSIFVLTEKEDCFSGSFRSKAHMKDILEQSGLTTMQAGHQGAGGTSFTKENESQLRAYLDTVLSSYEPHTEVLLSTRINTIPNDIFSLVEPYKHLYGQGIVKPLIHIQRFKVNGSMWRELGRGQTIKISLNDIEFIHFFVSNEKKRELFVGEDVDYELELVGEIALNEWNGEVAPQVVIDKFEVYEVKETDWDDLF